MIDKSSAVRWLSYKFRQCHNDSVFSTKKAYLVTAWPYAAAEDALAAHMMIQRLKAFGIRGIRVVMTRLSW